MTGRFPDMFDFTGFNAPSRVECDLYDLIVEGELPREIDGSWFRLTPDPQFPPLRPDTYLNGDGVISRFRIKDGHADFKMRYLHTERFENERRARRSLYGLYRNPYSDDLGVRERSLAGHGRNTNNTTPVWHGGRLLCLKEDSHALEVDPATLETIGLFDYAGQLRSRTMTAHPRYDPETGELFAFGYEAAGLATRDVAYWVADRDGRLKREDWFEAPYVSMMHDFAVTKEYAIFPVFPTTADLDRIRAGGAHWIWEPGRDSFVGIMPREGGVRHLRWFRFPARSAYHFMNAFSEGSRVHLDFGVGTVNPFPFIREASGIRVRPEEMRGRFVRWTFDLGKPGETIEEQILGPGGDMPRTAERDMMVDYEVGYYQTYDPRKGPPLVSGPVGAGFNTICRIEVRTGRLTTLGLDRRSTVQEHIHIPSAIPGHEGYLAFVVDLHDEMLSDVVFLEAGDIAKGPIARLKLPIRLRCQVHGNWVPAGAF